MYAVFKFVKGKSNCEQNIERFVSFQQFCIELVQQRELPGQGYNPELNTSSFEVVTVWK